MLRELWESRPERSATAVIDPELLAVYHSRSWGLLLAEDLDGGEDVLWDAMGWTALAVQHAVSQRVDVLLEIGTDPPEDAGNFAAAFREAGYRVEMEIMATSETVCKLHSTIRYHCRRGALGVLKLPDQQPDSRSDVTR